MNAIQAASAACRFLQDGSALLLWGAFFYLAALAPRRLAEACDKKLVITRLASIALALTATAAQLPLHSADFGQGWAYAFDAPTLHAVLFQTRVGQAWQLQMLAAAALAATTVVTNPARRFATATAAALLLASLALTGHAVIPMGGWGVAHRVVDALHLLCGGAWLGALPPLLITLAALRHTEHRAEAVTALRRFSSAGHVAVAGVIATGALNTWLTLGQDGIDPASTYQRLLFLKVLLVAAMTVLAICNRYRWVPLLRLRPAHSLSMIRRATVAEIGLGFAAVALVAVFGLLSPG